MNIKDCIKPISSLKSKPKIDYSVNYSEIVKLNYNVGKKLDYNKKEYISGLLDARDKVVI